MKLLRSVPEISQWVNPSYAMIITPRLTLLLLNLITFSCIKKMCKAYSVNLGCACLLWSFSYVYYTFLTRSFSNTLETFLFCTSILLLVNLRSLFSVIQQDLVLFTSSRADKKKKEAAFENLKKNYRKLKRDSFVLGVVLCFGVFNRSTFPIFMLVPLLSWFDFIYRTDLIKQGFVSLCLTLISGLLTFLSLTFFNSLYYNPEFGHLLTDLYSSLVEQKFDVALEVSTLLISAARIPPFNFILFNMSPYNLSQHGLHPWYTHLTVNLATLLGPLMILICFKVLGMVFNVRKREKVDELYATMLMPVIILSLFPHQEARFLLPIVPVAIVCAAHSSVARWSIFKFIFLLFNLCGFAMFGLFHQGGLVPAMSNLHKTVIKDNSNSNLSINIISYSSYMIPRHILFHEKSSLLRLNIDDNIEGQNHLPTLQFRLQEMNRNCGKEEKCEYYVLLAEPGLRDILSVKSWKVEQIKAFCPHFSGERLPELLPLDSYKTEKGWRHLYNQLCLNVVKIAFV